MIMENRSILHGIEPCAVFEIFCELSSVPRVPGKQRLISDFVAAYAKKLGLPTTQDHALNVVVTKAASPGYENASVVTLQAHMDMVCEKRPEVVHDFEKDPLCLVREGNVIQADGTTLGADNGIGMAFMLALLADQKARHPALEAVFTTDEETDMGGALHLDYTRLQGSLVLNLDGPAVGSCGCGELELALCLEKKTAPLVTQSHFYTLEVYGLQGGHTGMDAMKERGNAIILLNRILTELAARVDFQIIRFQGGAAMSSAFARSAQCVLALLPQTQPDATAAVNACSKNLQKELEQKEPGLQVSFTECPRCADDAWDSETTDKLTSLLSLLPDGVFSLNQQFLGAMESSANTGVVETRSHDILVRTLIRSSVAGKKYFLLEKISLLCRLLGIDCRVTRDLPHWESRVDTRLLPLLKEAYPEHSLLFFQATVECGIFSANMPRASILSLAPPFYNAHSPAEYILIDETQEYWFRFLHFLSLLNKETLGGYGHG